MSIPISQLIPTLLPLLISICLFSTSMSLFEGPDNDIKLIQRHSYNKNY